MKPFRRAPGPNAPYYVKFQIRKRQYLWCTGTSDKATARKRGQEYRTRVESDQFDRLAGWKNHESHLTIEEALNRYRESATHIKPNTALQNDRCLRCFCLETGVALTSPITALTDETVWKFERIRLANVTERDAAGEGRARRTIQSTVRQARSVFARPLLSRKVYGPVPPSLTGFLQASLGKAPKVRFIPPDSTVIDATFAALPALRERDMSAHVAFLLAATCGLRKGEIGHARWSWIDEGRGVINIRVEDDFTPKSGEARIVAMDPDVLRQILETRRTAEPYIIPGTHSERTKAVFHRLNAWLAKHGWKQLKKTHELRKYFGSQVATQAGLYAAQRILGHATPGVTNDSYAALIDQPNLRIRKE